MGKWSLLATLLLSLTAGASESTKLYWMKINAKDKYERSAIADTGVAIETVTDDYVTATGTAKEVESVRSLGRLAVSFELTPEMMRDFPKNDSNFHDYTRVLAGLKDLAEKNPDVVKLQIVGKSLEGRDIAAVTISTNLDQSHKKPGIVFMGTHHAREHLSTEMPLLLAQHLVKAFKAGDAKIGKLVEGREIHIIPLVNPDGAEYDISGGTYHMWRKNRRPNQDKTYGVDLNRNYGFMWGTGGSSKDPSSDTFMGPTPFSEPETQAVKKFVEQHANINILLSFHTFSELILYPWGHKYAGIEDSKAAQVHQLMAKTMAGWNKYTPQQSSQLYIASGDTTDWAFGQHKIISFTFELDPRSQWEGGFYPGQSKIQPVFQKNLEPCLYLMEYADNPYRVLAPARDFGLTSPLLN